MVPSLIAVAPVGEEWCRGCKAWRPADDVRGGVCQAHANAEDRERYASDARYRESRRHRSACRKRGVAEIPVEGRECLMEIFHGRCAYCPQPATTFDHIVPVSAGGESVPGNIVPACASCNSSKRCTSLDDWLARRPDLAIDDHLIDVISLSHC